MKVETKKKTRQRRPKEANNSQRRDGNGESARKNQMWACEKLGTKQARMCGRDLCKVKFEEKIPKSKKKSKAMKPRHKRGLRRKESKHFIA